MLKIVRRIGETDFDFFNLRRHSNDLYLAMRDSNMEMLGEVALIEVLITLDAYVEEVSNFAAALS